MALLSYLSPPPQLTSLRPSAIQKASIPVTLIQKSLTPKAKKIPIPASAALHYPVPRRLCFCQISNYPLKDENLRSNRIFIKGLPRSTSEECLAKTFSLFGEVSRVKIITNKSSKESLGFAYVWFTCEEDAQLAVEKMDGKVCCGQNCKA
ncbi:RNA-binding (RRM/RBD/RNP motifs) family protein isoform X2 [Tasmannia lanceolata]|uniref:RNA-binding (RRM/RBD/RNP motifs) family protein isoform X2 n=1 Tax=Tasmannia lanceolata TaxID=3420 RepID=UPI0040649F6E